MLHGRRSLRLNKSERAAMRAACRFNARTDGLRSSRISRRVSRPRKSIGWCTNTRSSTDTFPLR